VKALVQIEKVGQSFNTKSGRFTALRDIDLEIKKGEVVSLIGHSGCGKSTLLNLIAGLTLPSAGVLLCEGREIPGPGPERAVVFQNHSLLPWMTCFENVMLGVEQVFGRLCTSSGRKEGKAKLKSRVEEALAMVHMEHAMHKYPHEISGGMKQRIGIARAFAMEPKILLMDEPFGAVDAQTRRLLQEDLLAVLQNSRKTVVFVTHSMEEAVLLGDRVALMTPRPGRIQEVVEVDLPRPRPPDVEVNPQFNELKEYLWRKLRAMQITVTGHDR